MRPYFQKLKDLVADGRLRTYILIAPSRTNSSMVEHALGNSADIEHECHEPFLNMTHENFDPDRGYQQIYESIGGEQFERSGAKTSVVIKEMSHWIAKNDEYKRLIEITRNPIVILIRNPLLTAESRMRRVLTTLDMKYSISAQRHLLDEAAVMQGFHDWAAYADAMKKEGYAERPDFLERCEGVERIYDTPVLTVQNHLLDLKARGNGYANWRDLVDKKMYQERDYKFFESILGSNGRRLEFEKDEFAKLAEEVAHLDTRGKEYCVFDTTDVRAAPDEQMKALCFKLGITFSPEMIRWSEKPVDFHTGQTQEHERLWYDTLYASSRINPPIEIPPTLDQFPKFIQIYLREKNLPIYALLSKKKVLREELRQELNNRELRVRITDGNKAHLRRLGLIDDTCAVGGHISITLKHIDPIYAVSNDPELALQTEFKVYRDTYAEEIEVISEALAYRSEYAREVRGLDSREMALR